MTHGAFKSRATADSCTRPVVYGYVQKIAAAKRPTHADKARAIGARYHQRGARERERRRVELLLEDCVRWSETLS